MDALEEQVRHLVSEMAGVSIEKVTLGTRLGHDLGMDGMDAVEFFHAYEKQSQVNLSTLWTEWSKFFGPESWDLSGTLLLAVAVAIAGALSFLVENIIGVRLSGWLVIAAMFVLAFFTLFLRSRLFPLREISVADLIQAARQGVWRP